MNIENQRGLTLTVVLALAMLVSFVFIGLINIQSNKNMKSNQSVSYTSHAMELGNYMLEALRANKEEAIAGNYNLGTIASPHCTIPSDTNLVTHDQNLWMNALKNQISNDDSTCGVIDCDTTTQICVVTIFWDDKSAGGLADRSIEVSTRL